MESNLFGLKELEQLDLAKCATVSDIVAGMSKCAFGARMLGEVCETLVKWKRSGSFIDVVTPDPDHFKARHCPPDPAVSIVSNTNVMRWPHPESSSSYLVVVGTFDDRFLEHLATRQPGTTIFINPYGQVPAGLHRDGHFPHAVFGDPDFIVSVINAVLTERIGGVKTTVEDLLRTLHNSVSHTSRQIVTAAMTLGQMVSDDDCTRFLTVSGAMTIAQMSLVFCEMVDRGFVHAITATGALMAHGLVPGLGLKHYRYDPSIGDDKLAELGLNRVTDVLEPETNFDHIDDIMRVVLDLFPGDKPISPSELHLELGRHLDVMYGDHRAILRSAYLRGVPVFVPAFLDSELGNDVYVTNVERQLHGRPRVIMDLERDTDRHIQLMTSRERSAIMTWGGGVPRNNTQNVSPLIEIHNKRLEGTGRRHKMQKFSAGVRVCPDLPYYGHLTGCTYEEGMSWRKMELTGKYAQIRGDSTMVWPFLVKYLMDEQDAGRLPSPR